MKAFEPRKLIPNPLPASLIPGGTFKEVTDIFLQIARNGLPFLKSWWSNHSCTGSNKIRCTIHICVDMDLGLGKYGVSQASSVCMLSINQVCPQLRQSLFSGGALLKIKLWNMSTKKNIRTTLPLTSNLNAVLDEERHY